MPDLLPFKERSSEHLRLVLETSHVGIWELDLRTGFAIRNETHDRIFGYEQLLEEWSYDQFLQHVVEKDRHRVDQLQKSALEDNQEWSFDCQIKTAQNEIRWIKASGRPLLGKDGQISRLIGHVIDITDSKQNEARLQLVTEELNHRVRNMLAMIRSMIRLTAKHTKDIKEFAEALEGRVGALARTQNLLVNADSSSMLPSAIIEAELATLQSSESHVTISVNGEVPLDASAGQGLALVVHELLTNALKYGSLSCETGHVELSIERFDNTISICWKESGGPAPIEERSEGFGTMLISQALGADGTVEQIFAPEGLECRIALRLR